MNRSRRLSWKALPAFMALALLPFASACVVTPMPISPGIDQPPVRREPPRINERVHSSHRKDNIRVVSKKSGAKNPDKIRVCMKNSASGKNKGLHWKFEKKPRYIAKKKGQKVCGEHPTGSRIVTWHLFRNVGLKKMRHVASYDLDVTGREGQVVTFNWTAD